MEVRPARDAAELRQALTLRDEVFCGEQGVSAAAERDGRDGEALHLVAVEDGRLLGTCRLLFRAGAAFLGRLAVERAARRRGIGAALLHEAAERSREAGASRIELHAQLDVRELYTAGGYVERGDPFVEEGIDHVTMEKQLA
ncbi:MAG: GNAT family N-acetyltransferase [Thermoleophilaceae bacterium]